MTKESAMSSFSMPLVFHVPQLSVEDVEELNEEMRSRRNMKRIADDASDLAKRLESMGSNGARIMSVGLGVNAEARDSLKRLNTALAVHMDPNLCHAPKEEL